MPQRRARRCSAMASQAIRLTNSCVMADWSSGVWAGKGWFSIILIISQKSVCRRQPIEQVREAVQTGKGFVLQKSCTGMHAVTDRYGRHPGIQRHLHIIRTVADHDGMLRPHVQFIKDFVEHLWMWFGAGFICAACGMKKILQPCLPEGIVKSPAAFARGNGHPVAP